MTYATMCLLTDMTVVELASDGEGIMVYCARNGQG